MKNNISDLIDDVVASPLGAVIASVGEGVAEAQQALDEGSLAKTLEIYTEGGEEMLTVLREIGYRPTFYALPETTGEVRVSLHLGKSVSGGITNPPGTGIQPVVRTQLARTGRNLGIQPRLYATPVDAGYANRYGYKADISATLTFKIVPVPAPDGVDELRVLPDFVGKTIAQSRALAESLGLEIRVFGADNVLLESPDETSSVAAQEPQLDTERQQFVRLGEEILLTIA